MLHGNGFSPAHRRFVKMLFIFEWFTPVWLRLCWMKFDIFVKVLSQPGWPQTMILLSSILGSKSIHSIAGEVWETTKLEKQQGRGVEE